MGFKNRKKHLRGGLGIGVQCGLLEFDCRLQKKKGDAWQMQMSVRVLCSARQCVHASVLSLSTLEKKRKTMRGR